MEKLSKYYYVTAMSGEEFIQKFGRWAVKSLLKTGVSPTDIHVCVNTKEDKLLVKKLIPQIKQNIHRTDEDLSYVKWTYEKGKRKYSLFKIASLVKFFPKPIEGKSMLFFDGDVLFFKNPEEFLKTVDSKTWFHHGKDYKVKAKIKFDITEKDVNPLDYESLSKWVPAPTAYLLLKYGMSHFPWTECVAGLYLMHPKDHEILLKTTYEYTKEIALMDEFTKHFGAGDQKPMNAALNVLNIDWHGGGRSKFPECNDYFFHYFGIQDRKDDFNNKRRELNLV